ncbi:MAG: toll/interleukin-1 receptor domain-containing protein [Hyphomonadaceae bacterium]|nr:toll/interleukin-1 receptor domain-containing protein [Hyphomonadaceae bacterium]
MAKIFISYQRGDEPTVTLLAGALAQSGHSVWWDRGLGADQEWRSQIAEQLAASEVVLTIWTSRSRESVWVLSEADEAYKHRKLAQATIDGTLPPKPFDQLQCLDLLAWNGDASDPRLAPIRDAIERIAARGSSATPSSDRPLPDNTSAERSWMLIHDSLDPGSYRAFLQKHGNSPQASFARTNLEQLEAFHRLDHSRPDQISDFIYLGPFMALGAVAKEAHAYALENGPAMRFRDRLPANIHGHVLKGSEIKNGTLHADYDLPNRASDLRAGDRATRSAGSTYEWKQALRAHSAGSFHIGMHRHHHAGGAQGYLEWAPSFYAENAFQQAISRKTLDGLPVLVRTETGNELTPATVHLDLPIGETYLLSVWGHKPVEEMRRLLRAFDFEKVHEVCEGAASIGSREVSSIMRPLEPGDSAADGSGESGLRGGGPTTVQRSSGGVGRAIILGAILAVVAVAAVVYVDQTSGSAPFWEAWSNTREPAFVVEPYQSVQVLLARDDGSNYRAEPFARDDVAVMAESVSGEVLSITGVVRQPDGDWYQVRLRDGRTAYLKASLAAVQQQRAIEEEINIAGSEPATASAVGGWTTYVQWGTDTFVHTGSMEVFADGTFWLDGVRAGTWTRNGNHLEFTQTEAGIAIAAEVAEETLRGTMRGRDGQTGTFSARRS